MNSLDQLVIQLLTVAHAFTGYSVPATPPELRFVPQSELQEAACDRPCEIYGWFPPGKVIYLDQRLDPLKNVAAQGILLHELTHFLQQNVGAYEDEPACEAWALREREAYRVQARWLARQQVAAWPVVGAGIPPWALACRQKTSE